MSKYFTIKTQGAYRLVKFYDGGKFRVLGANDKVVGWAVNQAQGYMVLDEVCYR